MIRVIMRIQIMLPLDRCPCSIKMTVLQVPWKIQCPMFFYVLHCPMHGKIRTIRLRSSRQQYHRLRQRNLCLRQAQLQGTVHARFCNHNCLRIGKPDIFRGNDQQPSANRKQIPCRQQAGCIMQCCIFIRTTNGLLQGG